MGTIPWLCIVLYSQLSIFFKIIAFLSYILVSIWWCRRFIRQYRIMMGNVEYRNKIYNEESDAFYYLQKNDAWLLEKKFKFKQITDSKFFFLAVILSLLLAIYHKNISAVMGLPFPYIFVTIGFFPFVLLLLGTSVRGYLIYYYYPNKIKLGAGKQVYVDMSMKTLK